MTADELARVEGMLAVRLPANYASILLAYPFAPDSFTAESLLPCDAGRLIELNEVQSAIPVTEALFVIGDDGGEEVYLIDPSSADSPVHVFDLETGRVREQARNFEEYVQQCWTTEEEIRVDEESMARKRSWQFWR